MNNMGLASSFAFILLALAIVFPIYYGLSYAEAASGDTSDTQLNITSANMSASLDLLVTDDNGTFASNGTPLTFNVSTNNYTGYTVSIRAKENTTDLTNTTSGGGSFTSISGNGITSDTFDTSTYNGMWGIKPSYYLSDENTEDKFYPSPTTSGVTLNRTESANASGTSDVYSIGIAARATYAQTAGTYTNTYVLSAVGNYPEYKITYNANGGTGAPTEQSATSTTNTSTSINFSTTIPEKDGYEFIGWCDVDNSTDSTSCSGDTYESGDEYALDLLSSNTKPLYAIWKATAKLYMQDLTYNQCPRDKAVTVYDNRDETPYVVQRLADGNCWMLENLAFDAVTNEDKITASNTNIASANASAILTSLKSGNRSAGNQYATGGITTNWGDSASYSVPMISVNGACGDAAYCTNNPSDKKWSSTDIIKWGAGVSSIAANDPTTGGKVGVYYNY